jgi:hypothetical protein
LRILVKATTPRQGYSRVVDFSSTERVLDKGFQPI